MVKKSFEIGAVYPVGEWGAYQVLTLDVYDLATPAKLKRGEHRFEVELHHKWVGQLVGDKDARYTGEDSIRFPLELVDWLIAELERIKAEAQEMSK